MTKQLSVEEYLPSDYELELFNANCVKEAKAIKLSNEVIKAMPKIVINCFGKTGEIKVLNMLRNHKLTELNLDERYSGGEYRAKLFVSAVIVANHKGFVHILSDYIKWIQELRLYPICNSTESKKSKLPDLSTLLALEQVVPVTTLKDKDVRSSRVVFDQDDAYSKNTFGSMGKSIPRETDTTPASQEKKVNSLDYIEIEDIETVPSISSTHAIKASSLTNNKSTRQTIISNRPTLNSTKTLSAPNGSKVSTPNGRKVATPNGRKVATPNGRKVATPTGSKVATPTGSKVAIIFERKTLGNKNNK